MTLTTVPCQVVGCGAPTRIGWAAEQPGRQRWFMVCADHYARLQAGEPYVLAEPPFDLYGTNRASLIMDDS